MSLASFTPLWQRPLRAGTGIYSYMFKLNLAADSSLTSGGWRQSWIDVIGATYSSLSKYHENECLGSRHTGSWARCDLAWNSCYFDRIISILAVSDNAYIAFMHNHPSSANHSECLSIILITQSWRSSHAMPDTNETSSPHPEKGGIWRTV